MSKITIVSEREFDAPKSASGKGKSFVAFLSNGNAIEFRDDEGDYEIHEGQVGYDETKAVEVPLETRLWDGKPKYSVKR